METLNYSKYFKPLVHESAIIPGLQITDYNAGTLTCPRCGQDQADIPHGERHKCQCGLVMERWGNALQIRL